VTAYGEGTDVWIALGDPTRRAILECLAQRPCAVVELAAQLPVSRPAVSQHLKVLKESGLVHDEAVGTRHVYRLNPAGVAALRDQLDTFWNRALGNFESVLTGEPHTPHDSQDTEDET
jgi:DNA-binding transcriptional ArsR family regulator